MGRVSVSPRADCVSFVSHAQRRRSTKQILTRAAGGGMLATDSWFRGWDLRGSRRSWW